eukprot:scaffold671270_cov100-Prasinocladus_malaysianus.AAC.1
MLPEIALGPGRQALLEATSTTDRLSLVYDVLVARRDSLSALLTLQSLKSNSIDEVQASEEESSTEDPPGMTLREAARLERMMGSGTSNNTRANAGADDEAKAEEWKRLQ